MLGYTLVLILGAVQVRAQEKAAPAYEAPASTSAVAVSTAALSTPELKRLRNSETAALRKRQAAELEALRLSLKGKGTAAARAAEKDMKASHQSELAALRARHEGGAPVRAAGKGDSGAGGAAEKTVKPAAPGSGP